MVLCFVFVERIFEVKMATKFKHWKTKKWTEGREFSFPSKFMGKEIEPLILGGNFAPEGFSRIDKIQL